MLPACDGFILPHLCTTFLCFRSNGFYLGFCPAALGWNKKNTVEGVVFTWIDGKEQGLYIERLIVYTNIDMQI